MICTLSLRTIFIRKSQCILGIGNNTVLSVAVWDCERLTARVGLVYKHSGRSIATDVDFLILCHRYAFESIRNIRWYMVASSANWILIVNGKVLYQKSLWIHDVCSIWRVDSHLSIGPASQEFRHAITINIEAMDANRLVLWFDPPIPSTPVVYPYCTIGEGVTELAVIQRYQRRHRLQD